MSRCCLETLSDRDALAERLAAGGLSTEAAGDKAELFARTAARLRADGASSSAEAFAGFVPGRIEVLGKHTDYAGGRSMLATVEQGFCTVALPRDDARIHMVDLLDDPPARFVMHEDLVPQAGHWANYPQTVARRLARNFSTPLRGADIVFVSDLPRDAGMSSSSALVVSTFFALAAVNKLADRAEYQANLSRREDLAGYLGTIENGLSFGPLVGDRGVGTFGGSEDHTAMLCAQPDRLVQYAYCPVRFERAVDLPTEYVFALGVSGIVADKTGSAMQKYNRVSRLAGAALEMWSQATGRDDPHLAAAVGSATDAAERFREILCTSRHPEFSAQQMLDRLEHFLTESQQIIPSVAASIGTGELDEFGRLVDRSQHLGARLLGNQTPETIWLAAQARSAGALAASAFGAGFGGSVWALVPAATAAEFLQEWSTRYARAFPEPAAKARFFTSRAGPPAFRL